MNELILAIEKFGTLSGLAIFIAWKEIPMWLKKRRGEYVDFSTLTRLVGSVRGSMETYKQAFLDHVAKEDKNLAVLEKDLEINKTEQYQINLNVNETLHRLDNKLEKILDLVINLKNE